MLSRTFPRLAPPPEANARFAVVVVALWFWILGWGAAALSGAGGDRWWLCLAAGPIAWVALLIGWRLRWRLAAQWLLLAALSVVCILAWQGAFFGTSTVLVLAVLVVFAGWSMGIAEAALVAVAVVLLGGGLAYQGRAHWEQVLIAGYVMLFLLWVTFRMLHSYSAQMLQLRHSLDELGRHKQQLGVLFQAVEQSQDSVLIVDLQDRLVYANQAFEEHSGLQRSAIVGQTSLAQAGLGPRERQEVQDAVQRGQVWQGVVHSRRQDGVQVTESVRIAPVTDPDGDLSHLLEIRQDISQLLEAERRIRHLQHVDAVTQLPNRKALLLRLDMLLQQQPAIRSDGTPQQCHALLLLEIDRFQKFIDARGSQWSDALLQAFVARLQSLLPPSARLARTSASQFAVILERVGNTRHRARMHSYAVAEELQQGLGTIVCLQEVPETVLLSCSAGFSVFPFVEPGLQADAGDHVLRRASVALSQARHQGGGQVHAYSEALAATAQRRIELEKGLHVALQEGQLQLFVQPQVDMMGRVVSVEALVRWQHPVNGMVDPAEFIPVAEDTGMVVPMGDWVLEQTCRLLNDPRMQQGGYRVSVNVSALQFQQAGFVRKLQELIQRTGVDASRLTLEVTESLLLQEVEQAIQKMVSLRALGVHFALDDFGTGYSSLAYLMRLPIQEIKLDQTFIHDLTPQSHGAVLVEALLMVAKGRALRVVAEGVEHKAQAQLLQAWEPGILCQGYLFSRPLPASEWLQAPDLSGPQALRTW
ncbi:putative bifunctional diguanylate cyclase/phosphodiesterase [Comamonas aquatica]|uniref:EAL domain-containing protein n=1 Tax=Comamonas aquatica TaxID=225991 RepID=A0AA42HYP9_9BURK|nr:GGDEF domain-containing phosphodiesterase [Comamonas aquatica]MDH0362670.1 EAL domain-containing protein [Comamonas aquatica]